MAKVDLTFDELNNQFEEVAISHSADDITISVKAVTGDMKDALDADGVIEFMYKLIEACAKAQAAANAGLESGQRLNSFTGGSFSPPADGYVTVTRSMTSRIPLNTATVVGTNV